MFQNCTYVENPGFPNAYTGTVPGTCAFTVNRMQTGKLYDRNIYIHTLFISNIILDVLKLELTFWWHYFPDIAQIRLDFTNMKMGNPNAGGGVGGICDGDKLDIAAGATNLVVKTPTLCGVNTGQHGNS